MFFQGRSLLAFTTICLIATGCGKGDPSYSILPTGQVFKQNKALLTNQLDILWVIDNSGSMNPYQQNLVNNFNSFISNFQTKGYDFHIAVTTTEAYLANAAYQNNPAKAKFRDGLGGTHTGVFDILPTTPNLNSVFVTNASQGSGGSGDERAFQSLREALTSSLNTGFLRTQSFLAVIILSDEDDFSSMQRAEYGVGDHDYNYVNLDPISTYVSFLDTLTNTSGVSRRYNVSTISVLDDPCYQAHKASGSIIGQRHMALANATNGVLGSICDVSYAAALDAMQAQIATLSTQFYLDSVPQAGTISVKVDGLSVANSTTNGWNYNSAANSVQFFGNAVPPQNATVEIDYIPTTIHN